MSWSSLLAKLPDTVPSLVGALIGGFIGLVAAAVSQYLSHRFTRRRELERLRLTKVEELLCELYAHMEWVHTKHNALLFQKVHEDPLPLNRARAIQRLYFKELTQAFLTFDEDSDHYVIALLVKHHKGNYPDISEPEPEDLEQLHQKYLGAWQKLVNEITAIIKPLP